MERLFTAEEMKDFADFYDINDFNKHYALDEWCEKNPPKTPVPTPTTNIIPFDLNKWIEQGEKEIDLRWCGKEIFKAGYLFDWMIIIRFPDDVPISISMSDPDQRLTLIDRSFMVPVELWRNIYKDMDIPIRSFKSHEESKKHVSRVGCLAHQQEFHYPDGKIVLGQNIPFKQ